MQKSVSALFRRWKIIVETVTSIVTAALVLIVEHVLIVVTDAQTETRAVATALAAVRIVAPITATIAIGIMCISAHRVVVDIIRPTAEGQILASIGRHIIRVVGATDTATMGLALATVVD
jgi:hypothetical protein